jgi:hypothetical protein
MTSILKVDTIQDTAGNNIINESSDTITIGASGDTITIPSGATIDLSSATQTGVGGTNTPASNRFTVTSGFEGKYLIIAQYSVNISTDSVGFDLDIQKNGSSYTSAISKTNRGAIDTYSVGCSAIVDLTTNDYIEMFAYQATGGTITVNANDNRVFLGITKLIE